MARIAPFKALRYQDRDGSLLMAPPYDVLDEADTQRMRAKSPYNITHLIMTEKGDPDTYQRKADLLAEWLKKETLKEDETPSLYLLRQTFNELGASPGDPPSTRWSFTCCVGIEPYDNMVVLPHERTLSGPKADRLKLTTATRTNFSQIMGLYKAGGALFEDFASVAQREPDAIYKDELGVYNELWAIPEGPLVRKMVDLLKDRPILIADGHHRYETSMNYMYQEGASGDQDAAWMTFSIIDSADPGVVLYPIHRWVQVSALEAAPDWFEKLPATFDVKELEELPPDAHQALHGEEPVTGLPKFILVQKGKKPVALTIKQTALDNLNQVPEPLRKLDTLVLQAAFFENILGLTAQDIAAEKGVGYLKDFSALGALLDKPEVGAVLLCRPTPLPLVWDLAEQGIVLPQKSTFFYPKLPSGMTMRRIR